MIKILPPKPYPQGGHVVTVTLDSDGSKLHEDRVDLSSKAERERFTDDLLKTGLRLSRDDVLGILLNLIPAAGGGTKTPAGDSAVKGITTTTPDPFPTGVLTQTLKRFVEVVSDAMGTPPGVLGCLVLAVCAAAIGNSRRVRVNRTWTEAIILWIVPLLESGELKTPVYKAAMNPIYKRQSVAEEEYKAKLADYERELLEYEAAVAAYKKSKGMDEPPTKPPAPLPMDYFTSDPTMEAVAMMLLAMPRGLAMTRDELSGWLASFNQYRSGKGGDESNWLEMYTCGTVKVSRVTKRIFVPHASVSVFGTCQPSVFARLIKGDGEGDGDQIENGLAARFLLCQPITTPKRWRDPTLPAYVSADYAALVETLYAIPMDTDEKGEPVPHDLEMTPEARDRFARFVDEHNAEKALIGDKALRYHYAKLEGAAARLAGVVHLTRHAGGEEVDPESLDLASVEAGIALANWFKGEACRIYEQFAEDEDERHYRELVECIRRAGGSIKVTELAKHRTYRKSGTAEYALGKLVNAGLGVWSFDPVGVKGGRPSKRFTLGGGGSETPAGDGKNGGISSTTSSAAAENDRRERGEV